MSNRKSGAGEAEQAAGEAAPIPAELATPIKHERPAKGGSFIRQPDGSLKPAKED